jgi:hypothetical protein
VSAAGVMTKSRAFISSRKRAICPTCWPMTMLLVSSMAALWEW